MDATSRLYWFYWFWTTWRELKQGVNPSDYADGSVPDSTQQFSVKKQDSMGYQLPYAAET